MVKEGRGRWVVDPEKVVFNRSAVNVEDVKRAVPYPKYKAVLVWRIVVSMGIYVFIEAEKDIDVTVGFVGDGEEPKVVYVPFDPTLKVLKTDDGRIFDKPLEGKVLFFNKDKFLPLINTRPVDEIYDVPQHFALSLYNGGLGEGQAGGLKDLIEQLRQQQLIQKGLIVAFGIVAIVFVLNTKSYGEAVAQITGFAEKV